MPRSPCSHKASSPLHHDPTGRQHPWNVAPFFNRPRRSVRPHPLTQCPHPSLSLTRRPSMLVIHFSPPSRGKRRKVGRSLPWFPSSLLLLFLFLLLPLQPSARLAKPPTRLLDPYNEKIVQVLLDYSAAAYYCRTSACETWLCRCGRKMGGWGGQGSAVREGTYTSPCSLVSQACNSPYHALVLTHALNSFNLHSVPAFGTRTRR